MSQFRWVQVPPQGTCFGCGSSDVPRGFVDLIGETVIKTDEADDMTARVVDIYYCAVCIEQAAQLVGSASQVETMELAYKIVTLEEENQKLEDAVEAERQRFDNLLDRAAEVQREKREVDA